MRILCDRNQLQEAFSLAAGIVPQKTPKPILQNVLLAAENDSLTVFATDYEIWIRVEVDSVKITEPGQTLLPARQTSALLRELSNPTLTMESREFRCTLDSGVGWFVLVGDDPELFPAETRSGDDKTLTQPAGVLISMVHWLQLGLPNVGQ